ncbi:AI-2E family transporter [Candidatus Woesearchaeota archaeon]|nr:AI-2E family transporter [Candidatus Woesearchaeota archaeon]
MIQKKTKVSTYLFMLFFFIVLVLAVLIIKPFIATLLVSVIVAYALYPIYNYFCKITNRKSFSAVVLIILALLIASIPIVIVIGTIGQESYDIYLKTKDVFVSVGSLSDYCSDPVGVICSVYNSFQDFSTMNELNLGLHFTRAFDALSTSFAAGVSNFIINIPGMFLQIFIALFTIYYMFIDGPKMLAALRNALPMSDKDKDRIISHFNDIIYATIYGAIVLALMQGAVAAIGFFIFGVSSPLMLGLLTVLASFIPFLGAALVWLPVSLSMLITGIVANDSSLMLKAGGLVLYGTLLISTIDNFLRPKIVGDKAKIHPLIVLLGAFGGLAMFGFVGIMIGPLLLTLFIASLRIYEEEKKRIK